MVRGVKGKTVIGEPSFLGKSVGKGAGVGVSNLFWEVEVAVTYVVVDQPLAGDGLCEVPVQVLKVEGPGGSVGLRSRHASRQMY